MSGMGTAVASGTAKHFRVKDESNVIVFEGEICSTGALSFDNDVVVAGGAVVVNALKLA
jgi:hypothetical protein